jgi:hypothetical protein
MVGIVSPFGTSGKTLLRELEQLTDRNTRLHSLNDLEEYGQHAVVFIDLTGRRRPEHGAPSEIHLITQAAAPPADIGR